MKPKYDMLWKSMIEDIMADLLLFVDPDIDKELDLDRGFEFVDKELVEVYPEAGRSNSRVVDKLVKVFPNRGGDRYILLHLEVQKNNNKEFPQRMFEYFVRLHKRGRPVAAIAVLAGQDGKKDTGVYEERCLWCRVRYEYKTLRIADYADEVLAASTNPFATVMLVAKAALIQVDGTDEEKDRTLLEQKLLMVKLLNEKAVVFGEKKTRAIKYFLYNYVVFKNPETNRKFIEESEKEFDKTNITMGIVEAMHEIKREEGRREGLAEGRREGVQEGLEKAVQKLLTNTEFSVEKIAALMEVPVAFVKKIKKELDTK
jgi:predicted transposase YdaD